MVKGIFSQSAHQLGPSRTCRTSAPVLVTGQGISVLALPAGRPDPRSLVALRSARWVSQRRAPGRAARPGRAEHVGVTAHQQTAATMRTPRSDTAESTADTPPVRRGHRLDTGARSRTRRASAVLTAPADRSQPRLRAWKHCRAARQPRMAQLSGPNG
jgi:hypothetical protein